MRDEVPQQRELSDGFYPEEEGVKAFKGVAVGLIITAGVIGAVLIVVLL